DGNAGAVPHSRATPTTIRSYPSRASRTAASTGSLDSTTSSRTPSGNVVSEIVPAGRVLWSAMTCRILLRSSDDTIAAEWRFAMTSWSAIDRAAQLARSEDWILQRAVELAWRF